jgi:hypothetical protein
MLTYAHSRFHTFVSPVQHLKPVPHFPETGNKSKSDSWDPGGGTKGAEQCHRRPHERGTVNATPVLHAIKFLSKAKTAHTVERKPIDQLIDCDSSLAIRIDEVDQCSNMGQDGFVMLRQCL